MVRHGISAQLARVHASRLTSDLGRLAAGRDTIIVGPWLGEVGFELLYWVPFLRWFAATFNVAPDRLLIVSRGGTASWYRPFASGYRDIFDYLTPEEFRQRHDERVAANGEQKQTQVLAFERQVLRELTKDVHSRSMLHPSTMYGLFNPFWWGHVDVEWVQRFAKYERLTPDVVAGCRRPNRPYTAVKFYFNDCFPDTAENRAFVRRTLQMLAERGPVVSLATGLRLDDHASDEEPQEGAKVRECEGAKVRECEGAKVRECEGAKVRESEGAKVRECEGARVRESEGAKVQTLPPDMHPRENLALQTALVSGAEAFVGTYGGFSYLAPFLGVRSTAYFADPAGYSPRHLLMARSALATIGAGGLLNVRPTGLEGVV
jgi:hypothetical protein